ncbi:multidrug and toxin extrusion protein 1 isoform X2 [Epinephelus fuscoguttatus]|uniref:multidrug and toxin extrusion protein 1 isoform X2 n=1 Tax=Epinephelus fuscoguttatus TaxID=293821 RepID=UPI0020D13168|nr:multidrug and toxin extrusion protein 1 isoform X2 [Epinephelus fuscoguttatus]
MENMGSPGPAHPVPGAGPVAGVSVAETAGAEGDEVPAAVINSKLFQCACVGRWLPLAYREELYHILRLTGPLLLSRVLYFFMPFVSTIFCGHIGNAELAGYALAAATINVTTTSTGHGLSLACDTLISQTFGGKNLKRVGVILQRSILILVLACLPCWGLLINSYNLLLLLQQDDEVARIAQLYMMAFIPAVPAMFLHHLQVAYLQNQGIILPQMYTAAAANLFNLGANYVLIFSLELGVVGSAIANSLSHVTICLLLFGYIRWKGLHKQTWEGWSIDCLQEWGSFMKLAVPSLFMVYFEWWIWEVGGFIAGVLGEVDLAAQHMLLEIGAITYMFPLGIHAAACVRVGNALGAGNTARALVTCKVVLVLSGMLAVLQGIIIASSKSVIGYIFTTDENIVQLTSENLTLYTFVQFFDALLCVSSGILVGSGMQKIAALANLVCYYFIGLPVGIMLTFLAKLRVLGFWLGLFICIVLETGFYIYLIFRLNWKKVTHKAQVRAGRKFMSIPMCPAQTELNEAMVSDISDGPNTAQLDSEAAPNAEGYSPVITQDQDLKAGLEAVANNTNTGGAEGDAEQSRKTSNAKTQVPLSVTQLILRRGLTFMVLVVILAIGVAFHVAYPAPELSAHSWSNFTLNWANDSTPTPLAPLYLTQNL